LTSTYPVLPGQEAFVLEGKPTAEHPARQKLGMGLVHGFTGNPYSMRPLAEQLAQNGFYVDVPRLPGHGTDVQDMRRTRYSDWRAEVLALVDRLRARFELVMLVGLSAGGTLVLDVASSGERPITAIATINANVLDREGFAVKLAPVFEKILPIAPAFLAGMREDDIAKPGVGEKAYGRVPTAAGNSLLRELPRLRAQLPKLECPALIAYSPQDHTVPPDNSRAILKLLADKKPIELVLPRSYHVATMDYDLELLAERITQLADSVAS
jgi:carboxylesterase